MSLICGIDQTEHPDREALHRHLRKLKVKQEDYYLAHEPSRDRFTGEVIPWKAPADRYLALEFVSKDNLRKWVRQDTPEVRKWAVDWLRKRREDKALVYPPGQVELHSLPCPTARYYDHIGGYNAICRDLGYQIRFDQERLTFGDPPMGAATVIQDSREQTPLALEVRVVKEKLPYGDYGLAGASDRGVYIERKSLSDFYGTLSERKLDRVRSEDSNLSRFTRELERAQETGAYLVMLIEAPLEAAFSYTEHYACPEHTFHNLRDLLIRFPANLQALFVKDRDEAARAVVTLLAAGESVKNVDLQLAYDYGRLLD
jgi:hypothetical protein